MNTHDEDVYWIDAVGDKLESEGIDPGCIFEFSRKLGADLLPGGVVVSRGAPGKAPSLNEVDRVIVRHTAPEGMGGGLLTMPRNRPLVVAHFHLIRRELC